MNIQEFKITDGVAVIRYVNEHGERVTFDLTAHIAACIQQGIAEHMRKWHGHNL